MRFAGAFTGKMTAFTLIELLVVVSILIILAAILYPVFRAAKDASRRAVCVSHLRQAGLAASLYRDDWDGRYPLGAVRRGDNSWVQSWHDLLIPPLTPQMLECPNARGSTNYRTAYGVNRQVSGFGWAAGEWEVDGSGWYVTEKLHQDWPAYLPEERHLPYWKPLDPRHGGKLFSLHLDGSVRLEREGEVGR
jgi:type II secretory pathway pseudopilin PulG